MSDTGRSTDSGLVTIGEFGALTNLTAKALRLYDEIGLVVPASVDPESGYRRYSRRQVKDARLVGLLRGCDMPLPRVAELLAALRQSNQGAADLLEDHLSSLEARHTARRTLVRHIAAILREEHPAVDDIRIRHVPARRVMSRIRRTPIDELDAFVTQSRAAFARRLEGRAAGGPFTLLFHAVVDEENDGPVEAMMACDDDVTPSDEVGVRTEPAHDEAYAAVTRAHWTFPAILAVYDAVGCSPEVTARPGSSLPCREIHLLEPDGAGPDDVVGEVAYPLG